MKTKSLIAQAIIRNKVSALEISASIDEISKFCKEEVSGEFDRFGLRVVNFYIQSINFPDEDFEEINKILQDKASFDIIGDQRYVTKRTFDTMETAAGNENGMAGTIAGAGVGLGVGLGVTSTVANMASNVTENVEGKKTCSKCGTANLADARFCGDCGNSLAPPTIECPECSNSLPLDAKFCTKCGTSMIKSTVCSSCNTENEVGAKFCKDCGTKLGV